MNIREFLVSPIAYLAPDKMLDGISAAEAEQRRPESPHSVADVVAHLAFWQDWFYGRCLGRAEPMIASAADGWPDVPEGSWDELRSRFLTRLEELATLADGDIDRPLDPPIEFPPLASYTLGEALVHVATHNAYHLGQIVTLRQQMGTWPPPAGSWTW